VIVRIIEKVGEMQSLARGFRQEGRDIGFVPTMGALHEGHLSLVRRARQENDIVVVSIFVNPTQFGPHEDYDRYPRDPEGDLRKLKTTGINVVFMPQAHEMYPEGTSLSVDVGEIGRILCGKSRPGHFNGVATVVTKLFNIVMPCRAYFGQKDYQQSVIIRRLVRDFNFDTEIIVCPIVREDDGLAMSSRNTYLNPQEREAATILYRALRHAQRLVEEHRVTDAMSVREEVIQVIASEPLTEIDYVEIVDPSDLYPVKEIRDTAVVCLAVKIGNTRLIDNIIVSTE